ncbi:RsmB/NOP family class I SAM-dependent RNA methyltransferase [Reyranella sp.]|uniref:RsmB/NOP family class I SAM-dependent RNA methyltransferase n=1 Tax=Reyranella sp. TaxID=1929291 RepID=UPI0025CC8E92|nr:RsmB/NOP family class I SAM-dependent RNA methyltransferase [Reyranella sp.]
MELLDAIVSQPLREGRARPADGVANAYFRTRRFIGGGDRRAVSDRVWGILRRWGQLYWWLERTRHPDRSPSGDRSARAIVAADLMLHEGVKLAELEAMFDGGRYRPAPIDDAERRALRQMEGHSLPHPEQPDWVRLNVQEWVAPHLRDAYGDAWGREIAALETPPPVDLRVNRIKATPEQARKALHGEGIETEPMRYAPDGLRLKRRLSVVAGPAFQEGLVEIQDEGSQLIAVLVGARPGMQVADYCAGAGGKTLAIAAGMNNKGRVVAMDVLETRLDRSAQRLRRAGLHNVERRSITDNAKWLKRQKGAFDRVLVDAPCTGTGTWRRNPDGRWTLAPKDLEELVPKQADILDQASRLVKPGGRLVYATCSVLPAENERQIEAFLERHPEFAVTPIAELELAPELAAGPYLRLSPLRHGTDGFFGAVLTRQGIDKEIERPRDRDHTDGYFDDLDDPDTGPHPDDVDHDPPRPEE